MRGKANLFLLLPGIIVRLGDWVGPGSDIICIGGWVWRRHTCGRLRRKGHAQVSADNVDDGLALRLVILGKAFEGVQAAEPDRCFIVAELLDGFGIQLGDAPLGGVMVSLGCGDLLMVLPPEREHEPDRGTGSGTSREPGADGIKPGIGLVGSWFGAIGYSQQPDRYHKGGNCDGGDSGQHPGPRRDWLQLRPSACLCPLSGEWAHALIISQRLHTLPLVG